MIISVIIHRVENILEKEKMLVNRHHKRQLPFGSENSRQTRALQCRCQHLAVVCLIEDRNSKSKKGQNSNKKCILNCLP